MTWNKSETNLLHITDCGDQRAISYLHFSQTQIQTYSRRWATSLAQEYPPPIWNAHSVASKRRVEARWSVREVLRKTLYSRSSQNLPDECGWSTRYLQIVWLDKYVCLAELYTNIYYCDHNKIYYQMRLQEWIKRGRSRTVGGREIMIKHIVFRDPVLIVYNLGTSPLPYIIIP